MFNRMGVWEGIGRLTPVRLSPDASRCIRRRMRFTRLTRDLASPDATSRIRRRNGLHQATHLRLSGDASLTVSRATCVDTNRVKAPMQTELIVGV